MTGLRIWLGALVLLSGPALGDWVDSFFSNTSSHGSSSLHTQQRGFYSAGGFSGRHRSETEYVMTLSLPKLETGCGGITAFLGGMSFLDADYLMKKLQGMIQAVPTVAFDMAMKEFCKECSETLGRLTALTDYLNNIQVNECAMAKRLVTTVSQGDANIAGALWGEMTSDQALNLGNNRNWYEVGRAIRQNQNEATEDLRPRTQGCPELFQAVFKNGSVIAHATDAVGLSDYAGIMRGYVGDVLIRDDKIPTARALPPCKENNEASLEDMLDGETWGMDETGTCTRRSGDSIHVLVRNKLSVIGQALQNNQPLSQDQAAFVDTTPGIPVYAVLRKAILKNTLALEIDQLTDAVATAYVWYIFNNLYSNTAYLFAKVNSALTQPGAQTQQAQATDGKAPKDNAENPVDTGPTCDYRLYAPAIDQFHQLHDRLKDNRRHLLAAYHAALSQQLAVLEFQQRHEQEDRQLQKTRTQRYEKP